MLFIAVLPVGTGGCILPTFPTSTATSGHKHSGAAIRFLDAPTTTYPEVVSTLGPPSFETENHRVAAYEWITSTKRATWWAAWPVRYPVVSASGTLDSQGRFLLLVAFDQNGFVTCHEVRRVSMEVTCEQACTNWLAQPVH